MLYEIAHGLMVDLNTIDVIERASDGSSIITIDGVRYISDLKYENISDMIKMSKEKVLRTTSDSKFAG